MLKREIKYTTFNDEEVTEIFYFNISEPELIEMEVGVDGGMKAMLERIIETVDRKELIKMFKSIVLDAYGQKSEDGKRFIKNEKLREEFSQTAAYHALFMELATTANAAAEFVIGVFPKSMTGGIQKAIGDGDLAKNFADRLGTTPPAGNGG